MIARYDREKFAIILPKTDAEEAWLVAETIRASVKALGIVHAASTVSKFVTLSIGVVSVIPSAKLSASDLLTIAHSSVEQAKQEECDRAFVPILGRDASSGSHPKGDGLRPAQGDCTGASTLKGNRVVISNPVASEL